MTVSLTLDGYGLGAMWGKEKAIKMLNEAKFPYVKVKQLLPDSINHYYLVK